MHLRILLLLNLPYIIRADVFTLRDKQNSHCHVSNICERSLSLICKKGKRPDSVLNFTSSADDPWDAICSSVKGGKGEQVTFTVKGPKFEVREICTEIENVQDIVVTYLRPTGGTTQFRVKDIPESSGKHKVCIKKLEEEHEVVELVKLMFIPQNQQSMKITFTFDACGDMFQTGEVNTVPTPNKLKSQRDWYRVKGHSECIDEQVLNYENRDISIVSFTDGQSGLDEENALEGSGNFYTGQKGRNIRLDFRAKRFNKKAKFALWKVCFLVRYATRITYEMEGDLHRWIQSIDVCDPQNFLWTCYYPWGRFDEIEKGSITLKPEEGSQKSIVLKDMSISICLDTHFSGDIIRIGRATTKCATKKNKTDICQELVTIGSKDLKDFQTPFDLSDDEKKRNTTTAWQILRGKSDPFVAKQGMEEISFYYSLRRPCKSLDDSRFQARAIQFWTQHVGKARVKFCDTGHPREEKDIYCETDRKNFTHFTNPGTGETVEIEVKNPNKPKKFLFNNWFTVTGVNVRLFASSPERNPMKMWNFNIFACCDEKTARRDLRVEQGTIAKEQTAPKVTGDICVYRFSLTYRMREFYSFDDGVNNRDETIALQGSGQTYIGAPGEDIYFFIEAKDGKNFEWWMVRGQYFNVWRVTYIMITSTVTFAQSNFFCGNEVWHRTTYWPRNQGIYVQRGVVKIEVIPGMTAQVRSFEMGGCRDHYNFEYNLHVHPCDYKALQIDTPRNQTISIYAVKDKDSKWQQTELYHVTDHTGNDGDNTWFTLEPKHHLVSAIWTNGTYIDMNWDIKKRRVYFEVYLSNNNAHTSILLDLNQLSELKNEKLNASTTALISNLKHCIPLPFTIEHCKGGKDGPLVAKCTIKAKTSFVIPARYNAKNSAYKFLLPKQKMLKPTNCSSPTQVLERECTKHAILNRVQHQFICDRMRSALQKFQRLKNVDESRVYQACQFAYKTLRWVCAVMTDRPRNERGYFFTNACMHKQKFTMTDTFSKLLKRTVKVTITPEARNVRNQTITTDPPTHEVNLRRRKLPILSVKAGGFTLLGLKTTPARLPADNPYPYKVCIQYECTKGTAEEHIDVVKQEGRINAGFLTCHDLTTEECCTNMRPRRSTDPGHILIISYYESESSKPVRFEEFISTD